MICNDCVHKEVCGLEGYYDEALITCVHKTEIPHTTGHWIKRNVRGNLVPVCSECGLDSGTLYEYDFC